MPGKAPSSIELTVVLAVSSVGDSATVTEPLWLCAVVVGVFPHDVAWVSSIRLAVAFLPSLPEDAAIVAPLVAEARLGCRVTASAVVAPAVIWIPVIVREPQPGAWSVTS